MLQEFKCAIFVDSQWQKENTIYGS